MASDSAAPDRRRSLAIWIALWLTMLAYGLIAAPIPGVNEPHYLGKAKHFWNPAWCPGDLLLDSANAHQVFYFMTGFWAHWLPLPMLAVCGRLVGYGLLARGWQRTHDVLGLNGWSAWRSLLVFALASWGNFSGEWLVGGIEGKVISYACLMLAFADWQTARIYRAALWAGAAISFHPVVGMWAVLAAFLATATAFFLRPLAPASGERARERGPNVPVDSQFTVVRGSPDPAHSATEGLPFDQQIATAVKHSPPHPNPLPHGGEGTGKYGDSQSWMKPIATWLVLLAAALPGLIPALLLVFNNDPPDVRINGTYLQVYYRLAHHLDPMKFPARSYWCYAGMWLAVLVLHRLLSKSRAGRMWLWIAFWSAVFALSGFIAGYGPRPAGEMPYYLQRMTILKFYPFRLFDVLIPLTVAMQLTAGLDHPLARLNPVSQRLEKSARVTALFMLMACGWWRQSELHTATVFDTPEWIDVCHWLRDYTPADALMQTPVHNPNFKWHAGRAEYVTYKDVPQDNAGLVEWNRRMRFLAKWYQDHGGGGYSADELRQLREETRISYIVTDRLGPFDVPPCYTNDRFRVYDLLQLPE